MLINLLITLVLIPIIGFASCLLVPRKWERTIFSVAITAMLLEVATLFAFGFLWLNNGASPVSASAGALYTSQHYNFTLDFYFDKFAAVFMGMATVVTTLVFFFSRYYMHREPGFKRFYSTVSLFFSGLALIVLAGNFEVLLVGWELIGISSVLLIAFYRDRFLPARNALKVFSVYRIADAFLLVALWYAHHVFPESVRFSEFAAVVAQHGNQIALLGLFLFVVALIKSAQFPFSYWLPRAMEGPTTSSAIFYGALSVHMGLYLLLRTYPLWEGSIWLRVVIAISGLVTAVVASSIARVQSSAKAQIAYASVTQIGIMFIELAAGLHWLVLVHFVSNASLRAYQLLISPSTVSYLVHEQFFHFTPPSQRIKNTLVGKIRATSYMLGINEWNMNTAISNYFWRPLKAVGRSFVFLDKSFVQIASLVAFAIFATAAVSAPISANLMLVASTAAAIVGIIFYIRAYATKNAAWTCWNLIMLGHLFSALFLAIASGANWKYFVMYGVGVGVAFAVGHWCLGYLRSRGERGELRKYNGVMYAFTGIGHVFFIVALLFMAFPISPSFLAQDILLSSIQKSHILQIALFCVSYLLAGVSIMRLYTKVFFGPHKTGRHEAAYRSS